MNVLQALPMLTAQLVPGLLVSPQAPRVQPGDAYAVVTDLTDGEELQLFAQADGHAPQVRELTVLVTLYGAEQMDLADLRPLYHVVRRLPDHVTHHPGIPVLTGVRLGACMPPRHDSTARPWAAVRLTLTYVE